MACSDTLRCSNNNKLNSWLAFENCTVAYRRERAGQDSLCEKLPEVTP